MNTRNVSKVDKKDIFGSEDLSKFNHFMIASFLPFSRVTCYGI